jgi:hypothetical protein
VNAANTAISPFDFEIRSTYHQISRKRIFALVNATEDPIIQLATSHTADEISYLKRVLDGMFETYNTPRHEIMAITSMQAVRLCKAPTEAPRETQNGSATQGSGGQSLKMAQAEKMLKSLVDEGWFEKSPKGFYSLSPRGLMELRGWLLDTYNDAEDGEDDESERLMRIKRCLACKEIITSVSIAPQHLCRCVAPLCLLGFRVKDARQCLVHVGFMMPANIISFGCKSPPNARYVRPIGGTTISSMLGSESSPRLRTSLNLRERAALDLAPGIVCLTPSRQPPTLMNQRKKKRKTAMQTETKMKGKTTEFSQPRQGGNY